MNNLQLQVTRDNASEIVELVTYTIKPDMDEFYRRHELETFRRLLKAFGGFISLETYQCCTDTQRYMDIIKWESPESAIEANEQIEKRQKSPLYKNYHTSFDLVEISSRFSGLISGGESECL